MKKTSFIFSVLVIVIISSCETEKLSIPNYGSIEGIVRNAENYLPIQGALITTTPASASTLTDAQGYFIVPKIKEGEVAVNIRKYEYLSSSLAVAVFKDENTHMDLLLSKDYKNVGNISIYDPVPGNGAVDQPLSITLKWKMEGNNSTILISYSVYIFQSNSTVQQLLGENIDLQEVTTSGLIASTTYFWYVVAKYEGTKVAFSPTWSFKTRD